MGAVRCATLVLASAIATAAPARAADQDDAERRARDLYAQGQRSYEEGDYRAALRSFEAAYAVKPLPGFLFNLGQCHRQLGNLEQALELYRAYLDRGGRQRQLVEELIAEVQAELDAGQQPARASGGSGVAPGAGRREAAVDAPSRPHQGGAPASAPTGERGPVPFKEAPSAANSQKAAAPGADEEGGAWLWWTAGAVAGVAVVAAVVGGGIYYLAYGGGVADGPHPSLGRTDLRSP